MTRPRVICHMFASLDGRILTDNWPLSSDGRKQYELVHELVLLPPLGRQRPVVREDAPVDRGEHVADHAWASHVVVFVVFLSRSALSSR